MSLYNDIMAARRNILRQHGHPQALHLGWKSEMEFREAVHKLSGMSATQEKWFGMPLECGPNGSGTDYCAISWQRSSSGGPTLFEVIRQ